MIDIILAAFASFIVILMFHRKIHKKSVSTFVLVCGIIIYFCCTRTGNGEFGMAILALTVFVSLYRAMFKNENENYITWGRK